MKLSEVKDLVINKGYAIKNDDTVDKLNEVLKLVFTDEENIEELYSIKKYFYRHKGLELNLFLITDEWHGNSINLSEIELPNKITLEMVVDLRKQYPNNLEFGDAFDKLLNN